MRHHVPQRCLVVAYKKLEQETIIFIRKIVCFETLVLWRGRKTLIFLKTFFLSFEYLPLGNFKSLLLIKGPTFVCFIPPYSMAMESSNSPANEGTMKAGPTRPRLLSRNCGVRNYLYDATLIRSAPDSSQ